MTYCWKKMVFNLKVQSPKKPCNEWVLFGKIRRCFYLVYRPAVFHIAIVVRRCKVLHVLAYMRGLRCQSKNNPTDEMVHEEPCQCMSITKVRCINWKHQGGGPIQYFNYNDFKKCFSVAPAHSLIQILFAKADILVKIFAHDPYKRENHI